MTAAPLYPHGTSAGYSRLRCSCDHCRAWRRNRQRARVNQQTGLPDGDPRHGTKNGYSNYRCRCAKCRAASAAYARDRRALQRAAQ